MINDYLKEKNNVRSHVFPTKHYLKGKPTDRIESNYQMRSTFF